jgi:hypothetical protein
MKRNWDALFCFTLDGDKLTHNYEINYKCRYKRLTESKKSEKTESLVLNFMADGVSLVTILYARKLVWFVWVFQMALGHSLANNRDQIISPSALSDNALVITFLEASVTICAASDRRKC